MSNLTVTQPTGIEAVYAPPTISRNPFNDLWSHNDSSAYAKNEWNRKWEAAKEQWLTKGRIRSLHTRRAYRLNLSQFMDYMADYAIYYPWQVTATEVANWIHWMEDSGEYKKRSIAQKVASVSSYYRYCANVTEIIDGIQYSLLCQADGTPLRSPFDNAIVSRPQVISFSESKAVPPAAFQWIIQDLGDREQQTVANLRDIALLLMFGLNGWRSAEVLSMTWGKITETEEGYTYAWTGKARDGEIEKRPLPNANFNAIVAYLKAANRHADITDDSYIWTSTRQHCNLPGKKVRSNKPISPSTANAILYRGLFRYYKSYYRIQGLSIKEARTAAQKKASGFSIHCLRHMFARSLYEGTGNDSKKVQNMLGHKSLATTQAYLENMQTPVDDHSEIMARQLGLQF